MSLAKRPPLQVLILGLIALITLFFMSRIPSLGFDYQFEALFPNENKELQLYLDHRKLFEYDNEFFLIALENPDGIFKKDFLLKVDSLAGQLKTLRHVKKVVSPTRLSRYQLGGLLPIKTSVLHFEDEAAYKRDSVLIYKQANLVGSYFASDARSLCLYVKTEDGMSKTKSDVLAEKIEQILSRFPDGSVHYAGRIFAQKVYLDQLKKEFVVFLGAGFVFVLLLLALTFRTVYGTLVPLSVVLLSVIWTLGLMQVLGKPIDLMSSMLPTMIFVAGMSDVIHFYTKYSDDRKAGRTENEILRSLRKEVAYPTFLTLLSTVIGFLSLLFSSIEAVRDFGVYTSIGVSIAYLLTYTFLPALLRLYPPPATNFKAANPSSRWSMRSGIHLVFRNQRKIIWIGLLVVIVSVIGMSKVRVNNRLLEDLNEKVRIRKDFDFFDKHYCGARPFELMLELKTPNRSVWEYAIQKNIHRLDSFIRKEYEAGFVLSSSSLVQALNLELNGDSSAFPSPENYTELKDFLYKNRKNKDLLKLVSVDGQRCRLSAKFADIGSAAVNAKNEKLFQFFQSQNMDRDMTINITGAAHLIDRNNAYMVENMLQGFAFSILLIALLTFAVHRSWKMVLVFLIPNLIPLLIVSGIMGWTGIELKTGTALVFSIAFGIATDDTIHFISRLKIELQHGKSLLYAFKRTYLETGKPILLTTVILMGGFITLMLSDFQSIFYFGLLICITVLVALLADLFLLPVLLLIIYRKSKT